MRSFVFNGGCGLNFSAFEAPGFYLFFFFLFFFLYLSSPILPSFLPWSSFFSFDFFSSLLMENFNGWIVVGEKDCLYSRPLVSMGCIIMLRKKHSFDVGMQ